MAEKTFNAIIKKLSPKLFEFIHIHTRTFRNIFLLSILLLFLIVVKQCQHNRNISEDLQARIDFQSEQLDSFKNKTGEIIATKPVVVFNDDKHLLEEYNKLFNLSKKQANKIKELNSLITVQQQVIAKGKDVELIPIHTTDTVETIIIDEVNYVKKSKVIIPPLSFTDSSENYLAKGRVFLKDSTPYMKIDTFKLSNTLGVAISNKKSGFLGLGARVTTVDLINKNPNVTITGLQAGTVKKKTSKWHTTYKPLLGVVIGAAATYYIIK